MAEVQSFGTLPVITYLYIITICLQKIVIIFCSSLITNNFRYLKFSHNIYAITFYTSGIIFKIFNIFLKTFVYL